LDKTDFLLDHAQIIGFTLVLFNFIFMMPIIHNRND
jgi:hypothetical protein